MTKRSRNKWLALVVALGALALMLEFGARAQARRIVSAFAPLAVLSYAGAGISIDGSVRIDQPRLEFADARFGMLSARELRFTGPGLLWSLIRGLVTDAGPPEEASIEVFGLSAPAGATDPSIGDWLRPFGMVPFEGFGCEGDALTVADRQRMGLAAGERRDRLAYEHDPSTRRLKLTLDSDSPAFASVHGYVDLAAFTPPVWTDARARADLRIARGELAYRDSGYLAKRNAFCAAQLDVPLPKFIDRHVAAVDTYLSLLGVSPSEDTRRLYRELVASGGSLNFSTLPDASWEPVQFATYSRGDMLRQLNITARHDDAPPVMLRLAFSDPGAPLIATAEQSVVMEPVSTPMPTPAPVVETTPAFVPSVPSIVAPAEASVPPPAAPIELPRMPDTQIPSANEPERIGQRAPLESAFDPRNPERALGASAPPPPRDSTLALVWRPGVIERLESRELAERDYEIVAATTLGQYRGRRVRLLTSGGKLVDGRIQAIDSGRVMLNVRVDGGSAELGVSLANIREARLVRSP